MKRTILLLTLCGCFACGDTHNSWTNSEAVDTEIDGLTDSTDAAVDSSAHDEATGAPETGAETSGPDTAADSELTEDWPIDTTQKIGSTTSDRCDNAAGAHGCPCVDGACIGDLVCGAGYLCFEPDECQGNPGSPWCACVDGECLSDMDLICIDGTCEVDECPGVDRATDPDNCGACGNACTVFAGVGGCVGGVCQPAWGECIDQWPEPEFVDCNDYCGSVGLACAAAVCDEDWNCTPGQCDGNGLYSFENGSCETDLSDGTPFNGTCTYPLALPEGSRKYDSQVRCCCQ